MAITKPTIVYGKKSIEEGQTIFVREEDFHGSLQNYEITKIATDTKNKIEKKVLHGKLFPELFTYNEISLWWFFHNDFFVKLIQILGFTTQFLKFIDEKQPVLIQIKDDFAMFDMIEQICIKKKIPLQYSDISYLKFKIKNNLLKFIRNYIRSYRINKRTKLRIRNNVQQYYKKFDSIPSVHDKIIFVSPTSYRRHIYNVDKENSEKGEYLINDFLELLTKYEVVGISIDHTIPDQNEGALSERLESDFNWFPEEVLLTGHKKSENHKRFLNAYKKMIRTKEFQELFEYDSIPLWNQIESIFIQMTYSNYFSYWLHLLDSLVVFFTKNKPKVIFLTAEINANTLAFIVAAKKCGIKTIRIQQAIITDLNLEFLHSSNPQLKNSLEYPYPDIMLIFGEFMKRILIKNGYPSTGLVVFGNPVYFDLDMIKDILSTKSLTKKYNLSENQKIILFTSTKWQKYYKYPGYDYDTQVWQYLLQHFGNNKNFFIVLKPHPGENTKIYENILHQQGSSNVKIIQDSLLELLFVSSIVVTNYSSVIIDANCLNKPVIEVMWDDVDNPSLRFEEMGLVLPSKLNQLEDKIFMMLNNTELQENLEKNRLRFLKELYNLPVSRGELKKTLEKIIETK